MKPKLILGSFMFVVFLSVGLTAVCTNLFEGMLPAPRNYFFGGVLLLYAVLRFVRLRKDWISEKTPTQ